ncbi:MAG TPA: hypothetical protein VJ350_09225 [Methanoregula sp.]|nr:hypothetical protein [Methanoregula sp.]
MPIGTPKSIMVMNPETIVRGELWFMQTYDNLKNIPRASICVWQITPPIRGYKMNGTVTIQHGMEFKARRKQPDAIWSSESCDM